MAIVVATRCSVVAVADAGSSRIAAAATRRPAPATKSKLRPTRDPGPNPIDSANNAMPTIDIASTTAGAAGNPGSASRLMVRAIGS